MTTGNTATTTTILLEVVEDGQGNATLKTTLPNGTQKKKQLWRTGYDDVQRGKLEKHIADDVVRAVGDAYNHLATDLAKLVMKERIMEELKANDGFAHDDFWDNDEMDIDMDWGDDEDED